MIYTYPARLEADEEGRLVVHFPDLPEALTDGVDQAEALAEAADCLSEALASRIVDHQAAGIARLVGLGGGLSSVIGRRGIEQVATACHERPNGFH